MNLQTSYTKNLEMKKPAQYANIDSLIVEKRRVNIWLHVFFKSCVCWVAACLYTCGRGIAQATAAGV